MSAITTHVLDTSRGQPAAGVRVRLEWLDPAEDIWEDVGEGETDADGRLRTLLGEDEPPRTGHYRITFETGAYFASLNVMSFYPEAQIMFTVRDAGEHYHVPLLLSPYGYSTYRGS